MPYTPHVSTSETCWICLDEGPDDNGEPLVRNCGCRGDAGWAHVACLASFAKARMDKLSIVDYVGYFALERGTAWSACQTCKQAYNGELRLALTNEWMDAVASMEHTNPHRIGAMFNFAKYSLDILDYDTVIATCRDILSHAEGIDKEFWSIIEMHWVMLMFLACSSTGDDEQARALAERLRSATISDLAGTHPLAPRVAPLLEGSLSMSTTPDAANIEHLEELYMHSGELLGKDHPTNIKMAGAIGSLMADAGRQREAHDRAKRVFGESNPEYVAIKRQYLLINTSHGARKGTLLTKNTKLDGMEVTILRNTKDGGKYIVEYVSPETGVPQKLKVAPAQIILAPDTPVTNGREKYNLFVVSYDKNTDEYRLFAVRKTDRGSEYTFDTFPRKEFRVRFDPVPKFEF